MRTLFVIVGIALTAGCKVAATAEAYSWSVTCPDQAFEDARLNFTVQTTLRDGRTALDVPYVWQVDWVGVRGVHHQGRSALPESIRVKGAPGRAVLRILAVGRGDHLVEVASHDVEVQGGAPPAK